MARQELKRSGECRRGSKSRDKQGRFKCKSKSGGKRAKRERSGYKPVRKASAK